jgi:endonuclease/exonuclease/phosphatase (EEP) superfamily protein YafD
MTTSMRRSRAVTPPARGGRRAAVWSTAVLVTALAVLVLLPDLVGLDRYGKVVQLVSFRPQLLGAGAVLLVLLLVAVCVRRRLWPIPAGLAAVLLVGAALVLPRAVPDPVPVGGRPLTVLSFNAFEGRADPAALADLIRTERPDLVAVPEAGTRFAAELAPLVEPLGYRLHHTDSADPSDVANVVAAVADGLGPVQVRTTDAGAPFPYVEVTGGQLGSLRFAAVHTQAPVSREIPRWRSDLAALRQWCAGPTPAVVAGDLNATLDHSALRAGMAGCADAAAQRGAGLASTWGPTPGSRPFGPQIDHVLVNGGIAADSFSVQEMPGSDHRAILTGLRLPA